ncbi:MAG TPA: cobyrinic acid a,c-diamide synthase, partial [Allocoleopsis sp.]
SPTPDSRFPTPDSPIRIAVAYDRAFSFYYADNLELLQQRGVELVFWSPLADETLPEQVHGLYFGGGFPEVFAAQLSQNRSAQQAVRSAITSGIPTYAECGGLMYLTQQVIDFDGKGWEMVGVLPTTAQMEKRLTLGYRKAVALQDSPILQAGAIVWGHEFHRSGLVTLPDLPLYSIQGYDPDSQTTPEGWQRDNLHASYVHLHWGATPDIPDRFVQHCLNFAVERTR